MESKINFNAKIVPIAPVNDEFTLAKCYVLATGTNRNGSHIGEDAVNKALPTLFNTPVIAHLYVDENGDYQVGGHDCVLEKNSDGNMIFRSVCVPFGVVPERPNEVTFEELEEPNGRGKHTYLTSPVVLWTGRFPELKEAFLKKDVYFSQSMEINVREHRAYEPDKNYTDITDFSFSALCLLGEAVEPCFPMSRVEPYEFTLDDKFTELMSQLKTELASCFENLGKGGENMEEIKDEVIEQTEPAEISVDNPEQIEVPSADPVESEVPGEEPMQGEEKLASDSGEPEMFSSTYREKHNAVAQALPSICERDEDGCLVRAVDYWLCDLDDNYAYVERQEWTSDKGGCVNTKGRFSYAFNDVEKAASVTGDFEEMLVKWLTKDEASKLEAMRSQFEELTVYKARREKEDREAELDLAIAEFVDQLSGNEEFDKVFENRYSYDSVESLKDACYIVKGKFSITPQRKTTSEPSFQVGETAPASLHQRFHARYGKK